MTITKHMRTLIAAAGIIGVASAASAADFVVLDSNAEGIDAGLVVASDAHINLPKGATLHLIAPDGSTSFVTGPYSGPIANAARDTAGQNSLAARGQDTTVLGAVRAPKFEGGSIKE